MLIAGPNLTIDRTIRLTELKPGSVLRAREAHSGPGGKGVNVVRAATALGHSAELVAFVPSGRSGQAVGAWLTDAGVRLKAVAVDGEVRSAAIMLEDSGRTTVLNEPGPHAGEQDWERYGEAITRALPRHRLLACSGSTPPGSPPRAYANLVRSATERGVDCIVDANGVALANALEARPLLVTPNLAEADELLTGRSDHAVESAGGGAQRRRALGAAEALVERGAHHAAVTAGGAGLALATGARRADWLEAPRVRVRNAIGAGDALVAGLGARLEQGEPVEDAIRAGMAAAAAAVEEERPGVLDPGRARELERQLRNVDR